jgi:hypothetical protein
LLQIIIIIIILKSRNVAVGTVMSYGLDGRGINIPFPSGERNFSSLQRIRTDPRSHITPYSMQNRISFPRNKAAGTSRFPLTSVK